MIIVSKSEVEELCQMCLRGKNPYPTSIRNLSYSENMKEQEIATIYQEVAKKELYQKYTSLFACKLPKEIVQLISFRLNQLFSNIYFSEPISTLIKYKRNLSSDNSNESKRWLENSNERELWLDKIKFEDSRIEEINNFYLEFIKEGSPKWKDITLFAENHLSSDDMFELLRKTVLKINFTFEKALLFSCISNKDTSNEVVNKLLLLNFKDFEFHKEQLLSRKFEVKNGKSYLFFFMQVGLFYKPFFEMICIKDLAKAKNETDRRTNLKKYTQIVKDRSAKIVTLKEFLSKWF